MQIHHYSPNTREYLRTTEARPDPLDAGRYLIPAHATTEAPPDPPDGQVAVWQDGAAWQTVADNRGMWYRTTDGTQVPGPELPGEPAPESATRDPRPSALHAWDGSAWVESVDLWAQRRRGEVDREYLARLSAPYAHTDGRTYDADANARANLQAGTAAVNAGLSSLDWTDAANQRHTYTAAEFQELARSVFARGQALFVDHRAHKDAIEALRTSSDLEGLKSYDVEVNWSA